MVRGDQIVLEDHLVGGGAPGAVRYVDGVDLPVLIGLAPSHRQVPELYEAYSEGRPTGRVPALPSRSFDAPRLGNARERPRPLIAMERSNRTSPIRTGRRAGPAAAAAGAALAILALLLLVPWPAQARSDAPIATDPTPAQQLADRVIDLTAHLGDPRASAPRDADVHGAPAAAADTGYVIANQTLTRQCGACHARDEAGRMSRISYIRKTPEGWQSSIRSMVSLTARVWSPRRRARSSAISPTARGWLRRSCGRGVRGRAADHRVQLSRQRHGANLQRLPLDGPRHHPAAYPRGVGAAHRHAPGSLSASRWPAFRRFGPPPRNASGPAADARTRWIARSSISPARSPSDTPNGRRGRRTSARLDSKAAGCSPATSRGAGRSMAR